jgi:hypothetical protein
LPGTIDTLKKRKNSNSRLIIQTTPNQGYGAFNNIEPAHTNTQASAVFGQQNQGQDDYLVLQQQKYSPRMNAAAQALNEIRPVGGNEPDGLITLDSNDQAEVKKPVIQGNYNLADHNYSLPLDDNYE